MDAILNVTQPNELPFLKAVCWDLRDINVLNESEKLDRYERFWNYRGVLADITEDERNFILTLAKNNGSWLQSCV